MASTQQCHPLLWKSSSNISSHWFWIIGAVHFCCWNTFVIYNPGWTQNAQSCASASLGLGKIYFNWQQDYDMINYAKVILTCRKTKGLRRATTRQLFLMMISRSTSARSLQSFRNERPHLRQNLFFFLPAYKNTHDRSLDLTSAERWKRDGKEAEKELASTGTRRKSEDHEKLMKWYPLQRETRTCNTQRTPFW